MYIVLKSMTENQSLPKKSILQAIDRMKHIYCNFYLLTTCMGCSIKNS